MAETSTSGISKQVKTLLKNRYPSIYYFDQTVELLLDIRKHEGLINIQVINKLTEVIREKRKYLYRELKKECIDLRKKNEENGTYERLDHTVADLS